MLRTLWEMNLVTDMTMKLADRLDRPVLTVGGPRKKRGGEYLRSAVRCLREVPEADKVNFARHARLTLKCEYGVEA